MSAATLADHLCFKSLAPLAGQKHSRSTGDDNDDFRERRKYLASKRPQTPSTRGQPSNFDNDQFYNPKILCGRPSYAHPPIPVTLSSQILGEFVGDVDSYKPTARDNNLAWNLVTTMSNFFCEELQRSKKFLELLLDGYDIELKRESFDGYTTHGSASGEGFCYVISNATEDSGGKGTDPLLQAVSNYLESTRKHTMIYSVLPCILIYHYGTSYLYLIKSCLNRCDYCRCLHRICWCCVHRHSLLPSSYSHHSSQLEPNRRSPVYPTGSYFRRIQDSARQTQTLLRIAIAIAKPRK